MAEKPTISFDEQGRVRVLDAEQFRKTEELESECRTFVSKIREFSENVRVLVQLLSSQADVIEQEKLKAIGARNIVASEPETRRRKQREMQAVIDERVAEHDRLTAEYDSLCKVEREQKELLDRLMNNET